MINREELNWAAGFFDGEGSTFLSYPKCKGKHGTYTYTSMRMSVGQSGPFALDLLKRFQRAIGGFGHIVGPYKYKSFQQPRYEWKLSSVTRCQHIYSRLWPFLGKYKRGQIHAAAIVAIAYLRNKPIRRRDFGLAHDKAINEV